MMEHLTILSGRKMQQDALNKGFTRVGADEVGLYRYGEVFFLFVREQDGAG